MFSLTIDLEPSLVADRERFSRRAVDATDYRDFPGGSDLKDTLDASRYYFSILRQLLQSRVVTSNYFVTYRYLSNCLAW